MKKYCGAISLLLFGLISLTKAKPCPERTRPHNSRCDAYYKCTELTAGKHAWLPTSCEEGLVYEHSLAVCVLPADDWECLMGDYKTNLTLNENIKPRHIKTKNNRDADIYIVSNEGEDRVSSLNNRYDDSKVEIIIGPNISGEDKDEEGEEEEPSYDGSGSGGELVELDGLIPSQNREAEIDDVSDLKKEEQVNANDNKLDEIEQKEGLEEMLQTIKINTKIGQSSTNIDPKLTAHLQRLSQLIDGLKETYQTGEDKPQDQQTLRPDQLNAFLAHFNIKNKFDSLNSSENIVGVSSTSASTSKLNRTLHYMHESNINLNPETKVVLSNTLPHHYDNSNSRGGYSNSQIVVNRPEGSVLFSLPDHHYMDRPEYSSDAPKISKETLKTVLELSKQMIAQQNVPNVIPNPTFLVPPILQPILLTPHVDSPFSTNFNSQNSNSLGFSGLHNQNYKYKKTGKRPQLNGSNNGYNDNDNGNYQSSNNNGYSSNKPGTTIIHNNVIPVHLSVPNSGEKEVLDSYGQSVALYPPLYEEMPSAQSEYHSISNSNNGYSSSFQSNEYSVSTTINPSSSPYGSTPKPFEFQSTTSTINKYFTPSQHLDEHNVNNVFSSVDNYGSILRPLKGKKPNIPNYKLSHDNIGNEDGYGYPNHIFPQVNSHSVHVRPNSHNFESFENENDGIVNNYHDDNNYDEPQLITYSYGSKKKSGQQGQFSNYGDYDAQSSIDTVFSSSKPYLSRPQSAGHNSMSPSNGYYSSGKNKYTPISSPISSSYGDGTQLVNVGGNFISLEVFQNSILPLMGNNPTGLSSSALHNVEVITCSAGVRQPNITDCTRYYVCSKKDGKVLSYSCPPYTAFNSDTRICDAKTFALCNSSPIVPNYSVSENKRIQMETLKALQETKRRQMLQQQQQQAIDAQNMANLLQQVSSSPSSPFNNPLISSDQDSSEQSMLNSYTMQLSQSVGTTPMPQLTTATAKKRKYYCKEGDKIADQTSIYNYFVCYKNAKGQMKGHRMTCSKGLLFCPKTSVCTLPSKCS